MNRDDDRLPYLTPPRQPEPSEPSPIEQIFDAATEAARRSARKPPSGPVARILGGLTIVAGLVAAATLVYGIVMFPDAPIRETPKGFVGKTGAPHTAADHEGFQQWLTALFIIFPTAFALGFAYAAASSLGRRKTS